MKAISRTKISVCRICGKNNFEKVIVLPEMPLTDEFIAKENIGREFIADIEIALCKSCGATQNMFDTTMEEYYNDYTYSVQSSGFAIKFMQTLANRVKENYFKDTSESVIIEIGSGSGEQLSEFAKSGFHVLGIEPSLKLSTYANDSGIKTVNAFFDEKIIQDLEPGFKKADAVITSYTFDHIPKPVDALKNIYSVLKENGILIVEVHDLELITKRNEFCLFEHEHYTYLNEQTLSHLLNANNFEVLTFSLLGKSEKRANSLLVVARKREKVDIKNVNTDEEAYKLKELSNSIQSSIKRIDEWLQNNSSKKIAAYGAGGRGIMTIAALRNSNYIQYIVDKNPKAENIFAPKSHLPVYGIEKLKKDKVDLILIFSFGYYAEIVKEVTASSAYDASQFISVLDLLEIKHA